MKFATLREFKPTIIFLIKFIGLYLIGNLLYGWFVTSFRPTVDPATHTITVQTAALLNMCGVPVSYYDHPHHPSTSLLLENEIVLSVYEGCNSINTMVIFLSFLLAFGPYKKALWWFIPVGLVIIYAMNIVRILSLFTVSRHLPHFLYFTHKYLFTGILFTVIFALWWWWIRKFAKPARA